MILDSILQARSAQKQTVDSSRGISFIKALSWRIVGTIDTICISYLLTGKPTLALSIGSIEVVTKMVLYYLHERAWERIKWVRIRQRTSGNG